MSKKIKAQVPANQIFAIVVEEHGVSPYILPDCSTDLERARELMAFRAEELVDEFAAGDADAGIDVREYMIALADDKMSIKLTADGQRVVSFNIQTTSLVDVD